MYYNQHMFGRYIRKKREELKKKDRSYSLRQVAFRVGVEPAYLSKIERRETPPPSEEKIRNLAAELDVDPDYLLAMAGKVAGDLQGIIRKRPVLFAGLLRVLQDRPDMDVAEIAGSNEEEETA